MSWNEIWSQKWLPANRPFTKQRKASLLTGLVLWGNCRRKRWNPGCTWFGVLWWRKLSPLLRVDSCDATGWAAGPRDCQRAGLLAHLAGALPAQAQWPTGLDLYWPVLFIQSVKQRTRNSVIDQSKDLWFHCKHGAGDLRGGSQCRDNCPQKQ